MFFERSSCTRLPTGKIRLYVREGPLDHTGGIINDSLNFLNFNVFYPCHYYKNDYRKLFLTCSMNLIQSEKKLIFFKFLKCL